MTDTRPERVRDILREFAVNVHGDMDASEQETEISMAAYALDDDLLAWLDEQIERFESIKDRSYQGAVGAFRATRNYLAERNR